MNKALTLRDIRRVCGLGPLLTAEELDKYWVDTDPARTPNSSLRNRVRRTLEDKNDARILVYGHGGSGKSTELAKLIQELGGDYFPVRFSIRDEMNPVAIQAEDVMLVLTERLLAETEKGGFCLGDDVLRPIYDYFATVTRKVEQGRDASMGVSAEASASTGFFIPLVKLMAKFKSEIKLNAHSEETVVATLRKRPADLLEQINGVVRAVRQRIPREKRLLIVVEDLDKLGIACAHRVFIDNGNLLAAIVADVIYTVPIFTLHSPDAGVLRSLFRPFGLAMIKTFESDGRPAPGFDVVKKIILARIDEKAVDPGALDLLVRKTGGVLQHAFEVLRNAALMDSATLPLKEKEIVEALKVKRSEFWSEIALPIEPVPGVASVEQLYDRLTGYAKRQLAGERNPPQVDAINQILLRACALVEYNGDRWYGVHPLVIDNLKELGRVG